MKRLSWIMVITVIFFGFVLSGCNRIDNDAVESTTLEGSTALFVGYTWKIEPKYDCDHVGYDVACGRAVAIIASEIYDESGYDCIDPITGGIVWQEHGGHGGGDWLFAVNKNGKYGKLNGYAAVEFQYETLDELIVAWEGNLTAIRPVILFDTEMTGFNRLDGPYKEIPAYKCAYTNNGAFITDYIFDLVDENQNASHPAVCIIENEISKWGFINDSGEQIIDFVFDGAVSIDDATAFVKQNGKWGIIYK